ncbi:MAG: RNA polymerase sigma factor [Solirubrobacteraceae bacterium]
MLTHSHIPDHHYISDSYAENRTYVLSVLGRRSSWLEPAEREALFHDACVVLLEKQRDGRLDASQMGGSQVRAYLTQTALHKAFDEHSRAGRRLSVSLDAEGFDPGLASSAASVEERVLTRDETRRVRDALARLPRRRELVVTLRLLFGLSPLEIQGRLGVSERVYRRELERGRRTVAATLRAGA